MKSPPRSSSAPVAQSRFSRRQLWGAFFTAVLLVLLWFGWGLFRDWTVAGEAIPARLDLAGRHAGLVERMVEADRAVRSSLRPAVPLKRLVQLYHANGYFKEAERCYRGLIEIEPRNPLWPHLLASILSGYGQLDEALPLLRHTVELAPGYLPAQLRLGDAWLKINQPANAAAAYGEVLRREPANAYAMLGLARLGLAARNWSEAREWLKRAVVAQPDLAGAWSLLATAHEHFDEPDLALIARKRAAARPREAPDPWLDALADDSYDAYQVSVAAAIAALAGDKAVARGRFERAVTLAPEDASLCRVYGKFLAEQGESVAARAQFERAVVLAPGDADGWLYLFQTLGALGETSAAEQTLAQGLLNCPTSPGLHYEKGRRFAAVQDYVAAIAEFQETKRLRPQEANAFVDLAIVYLRLGRTDEGLAEFRAAHAAEPGHPMPPMALARHAIEAGDESAARHWINRLRMLGGTQQADVDTLAAQYRERFGRSLW